MKLKKQPKERKEAAAMESKSAEITALTLSSCKSLLTDMYKTFEKVGRDYEASIVDGRQLGLKSI